MLLEGGKEKDIGYRSMRLLADKFVAASGDNRTSLLWQIIIVYLFELLKIVVGVVCRNKTKQNKSKLTTYR